MCFLPFNEATAAAFAVAFVSDWVSALKIICHKSFDKASEASWLTANNLGFLPRFAPQPSHIDQSKRHIARKRLELLLRVASCLRTGFA